MRLILDLTRTPAGQFIGNVHGRTDPAPVAFAGTLELLRVLEDFLDLQATTTAEAEQSP